MVNDKPATGRTVVVTVAVAGVKSCSFAVATAVLVITLAALAVTVTTIETVPLDPLLNAPTAQTMVVAPEQPELNEASVTPAGRVSVTITPVALDGPLLLTVNV